MMGYMAIRQLKTMDDVLLDGKVVLVRVDFNVAVGEDGVVDKNEDHRIQTAIPTIEELIQRRCKVVLLTHLGRPQEGQGDFDLAPVRRRLEELLREEVRMLKHLYGDDVTAAIAGLSSGGVVMLPNVRLDEREVAGSEKLAREMADVGDVYINEAFSVSHRNHTSMTLLPALMHACAGRRLVEEYDVLSKLEENPERPYVAVVSGAKVATKMKLLEKLVQQVDKICLGGVLANTFLVALRKCSVEQCSSNDLAAAEKLWSEAEDKIELPEDVVVGQADGGEALSVSVSEIPTDVGGVWDIGPHTVRSYLDICQNAKSVMWNGPLGMVERPAYAEGTNSFAAGLAQLLSYRVVGGGDTVNVLEKLRLVKRFDYVSVGGSAMIAKLEGSDLPGLQSLYK